MDVQRFRTARPLLTVAEIRRGSRGLSASTRVGPIAAPTVSPLARGRLVELNYGLGGDRCPQNRGLPRLYWRGEYVPVAVTKFSSRRAGRFRACGGIPFLRAT